MRTTQGIVILNYNILLSQCLSYLNFGRFIVLTSVGFGTMVGHVQAILQQCVPASSPVALYSSIQVYIELSG